MVWIFSPPGVSSALANSRRAFDSSAGQAAGSPWSVGATAPVGVYHGPEPQTVERRGLLSEPPLV